MELNEIKQKLSGWAQTKPLIKTVYVFGSRARATHRNNSDLDIAIELDEKEVPSGDDSGGTATWFFKVQEWRTELAKLIPLEIHLEHYEGEKTPTIAKGITKSSVLIYQKII